MKHLSLILTLVGLAVGAPITYDQRQDGELNVRADLKNFVVIALVPKIDAAGPTLLEALSNSLTKKALKRREGGDQNIVDRADARGSPYQVDISKVKSSLAKLYPAEEVEAKSASVKLAQPDSPVPNVKPVKDNKYVSEESKGEEPVGEVIVAQV